MRSSSLYSPTVRPLRTSCRLPSLQRRGVTALSWAGTPPPSGSEMSPASALRDGPPCDQATLQDTPLQRRSPTLRHPTTAITSFQAPRGCGHKHSDTAPLRPRRPAACDGIHSRGRRLSGRSVIVPVAREPAEHVTSAATSLASQRPRRHGDRPTHADGS